MHRLLQLQVTSTEGLRIKKKSITKNLFAIIRADCNNNWTSKQPETGSKTGHECKHDNMLEMDLPMHVGFISLEVYYYKEKNCGNSGKFVGAARIPVSDFMGNFVPENYVHYLSYRLRDVDGVRNGVINVSIKVKTTSSSGFNVPKVVSSAMPELGVPAYDVEITPGVVTGVPVNLYALSCT